MKGLTIEQMEFLASKGLDAAEMIAFAKMGATKSKGAERTARWRARKQGNVTDIVTSDVTRDASPPPIDNTHTPPVSSNEETRATAKKTKSKRASPPAKPEGVTDQVWSDFTDHRRRKGGLTQTALDGIAAEAAKAGWTLEDALKKIVSRNWQGFEAEWVEAPKPSNDGGYLDHLIAKKARGP